MSKASNNVMDLVNKKFDYSSLNSLMGDLKSGFAHIDKSQEVMNKNLKSVNNRLYKQIMPIKK